MKEIKQGLDRVEKNLINALKDVQNLKELFNEQFSKVSAKQSVLDTIKELGNSNIQQIAEKLGKEYTTIDNLCRSLYLEKKLTRNKEKNKYYYSIK